MDINNRTEFAAILRQMRAENLLCSYGRLSGFGRSLVTVNGARFYFTGYTNRPPMNIHRAGGAR